MLTDDQIKRIEALMEVRKAFYSKLNVIGRTEDQHEAANAMTIAYCISVGNEPLLKPDEIPF